MQKKDYKGRCTKRTIAKCQDVCRTYTPMASAYADLLAEDDAIEEIRCNVLLDGLKEGAYTSDFVCQKTDGTMMVRECVYRSKLLRPLTLKNLDLSRNYWRENGITDWGIVIDEEK